MKPQQRNFIVEVKSSRRRSAVRPTSIWGDTDLKALVREAEVSEPHLFDADGETGNAAPRQSGEPSADVERTMAQGSQSGSVAAVAEETAVLPQCVEEIFIPLVEIASATLAAPQLPKRPRRPRVLRRAQGEATVSPTQVTVDELAGLEEENRRLKGLLARRLRRENALLREMLQRF
ncbi:hypothetical protein [Ensifer sp. ZNC0028]|uniref:hypothetical protein n=1 Tax=Ensifer sp. ZNC0028 TaxID=1339236 RepID=UPI0012E06DD6|nr:hypothetical protein [Ensifer sp. ZNC0028]